MHKSWIKVEWIRIYQSFAEWLSSTLLRALDNLLMPLLAFFLWETQLFVKRFTAITARNDCKSHSSRCKLETYKTDKQSINLSNPQLINLIWWEVNKLSGSPLNHQVHSTFVEVLSRKFRATFFKNLSDNCMIKLICRYFWLLLPRF